jgi:hypothetical protein
MTTTRRFLKCRFGRRLFPLPSSLDGGRFSPYQTLERATFTRSRPHSFGNHHYVHSYSGGVSIETVVAQEIRLLPQ